MRPIERCLSVITAGDGDPGLVRDELRALKGRKKDMEPTLGASYLEQEIELNPNLAVLYGRKASELQFLLTDESSRP